MSDSVKRSPILDQFSMISRPYTRLNGLTKCAGMQTRQLECRRLNFSFWKPLEFDFKKQIWFEPNAVYFLFLAKMYHKVGAIHGKLVAHVLCLLTFFKMLRPFGDTPTVRGRGGSRCHPPPSSTISETIIDKSWSLPLQTTLALQTTFHSTIKSLI